MIYAVVGLTVAGPMAVALLLGTFPPMTRTRVTKSPAPGGRTLTSPAAPDSFRQPDDGGERDAAAGPSSESTAERSTKEASGPVSRPRTVPEADHGDGPNVCTAGASLPAGASL